MVFGGFWRENVKGIWYVFEIARNESAFVVSKLEKLLKFSRLCLSLTWS